MNTLTIPRALAGAEYTVLRLPLTVVETQVVARLLDEESALRLAFERAVGTLDSNVGRLLGDADLTRRGAPHRRRADILEEAAQLDEKAAARKAQATATLREGKQGAEAQRAQAEHRAEADAKALRTRQQAERRAAQDKAQAAAGAKAAAVERQAEARLDAEAEALDARVTTIEARAEARKAAPKAQLEDAVKVSQQATQERRTADRLGELADTEKASRRGRS
jgi:hypothetical protein